MRMAPERACLWILLAILFPVGGRSSPAVVNDVTQLNPIVVSDIATPTTLEELVNLVAHRDGPISIGGGRFSMGGQTATENAVQIDMRQFDRVLAFSAPNKEITVQARDNLEKDPGIH